MRIVGLIAEYNPFHNGHKYHIEKAKEIARADAAVVVMSGNFVQRGTPAIMPKHLRTEAALVSGADLVIELPLYFATGSAETFAYGAVSLLNSLGCIDVICFGSECGDIDTLKSVAFTLYEDPQDYKRLLQDFLRQGFSFPSARQKALQAFLGNHTLAEILEKPNNILGLEYLKALYRLDSNLEPLTITRKEAGYHDTTLGKEFSSASAIRKSIYNNVGQDKLLAQIPEASHHLLEFIGKRFPVFSDDFSLLLKHRILTETANSLTQYADVSDALANKIINLRNKYVSFEQFCELLKTKDITYARISRALLHILLRIKKRPEDAIDAPSYARVLGFRKNATHVMTKIKNSSSIPLVTKLADAKIDEDDIFASDLYESVITEKYHTPFINEYEHPIVRI